MIIELFKDMQKKTLETLEELKKLINQWDQWRRERAAVKKFSDGDFFDLLGDEKWRDRLARGSSQPDDR